MAHWDGPEFNYNNFYLYFNPVEGRFIMLPHGMDQVFDVSFDFMKWPKPLIARRIREIPELDARLRSEMNRMVQEVWDPWYLAERMDRVGAILHAIPNPSGAIWRDVDLYNRTYDGMRAQIFARPESWNPL
jgi:hypothetical protein